MKHPYITRILISVICGLVTTFIINVINVGDTIYEHKRTYEYSWEITQGSPDYYENELKKEITIPFVIGSCSFSINQPNNKEDISFSARIEDNNNLTVFAQEHYRDFRNMMKEKFSDSPCKNKEQPTNL